MTRADDHLAFQVAFGQITAVVGTLVLDGEVFAAEIEHGDGHAVGIDDAARTRRQLGDACDIQPGAHIRLSFTAGRAAGVPPPTCSPDSRAAPTPVPLSPR